MLAQLSPWVYFGESEFHCFPIDRAEANVNNNYRPEDAYFIEESNVVVAWPTKLTLTPNLADTIIRQLAANGVTPSGTAEGLNLSGVLDTAQIATSRWE